MPPWHITTNRRRESANISDLEFMGGHRCLAVSGRLALTLIQLTWPPDKCACLLSGPAGPADCRRSGPGRGHTAGIRGLGGQALRPPGNGWLPGEQGHVRANVVYSTSAEH